MIKNRTFILLYLISFILPVVIFSIVEVVVDPCFHYHKPLDGLSYGFVDERYMNNGIVRNFDYNAVITGTSMTENFKTTEMDEIFGTKSIKVPFAGGHYKEIDQNIKTAIANNQDVKLVIRGLDLTMIVMDKDSICNQLDAGEIVYPYYMNDGKWYTDLEYVLNKDIFFKYTYHNFALTKAGEGNTSFDEYAFWDDNECGNIDLEEMASYRKNNLSQIEKCKYELTDADKIMLEENVRQNILQTALDNPDIEFIVFLTPYSIVWWDDACQSGKMRYYLDAIEMEMKILLEADNISIYSFIDSEDIVCNLDNYIDKEHYHANINSQLLQLMYTSEGKITTENIENYMLDLRDFIYCYDYDDIYISR